MSKGFDSAIAPSDSQMSAARVLGATWWGWYCGDRSSAWHTWSVEEVNRLRARFHWTLPIWVPPVTTMRVGSGNGFRDALLVCWTVGHAYGWADAVALDTEQSWAAHPGLPDYIDAWNRGVEACGWKSVVYEGAGIVSRAFPWVPQWGAAVEPRGAQCIQRGPGRIGDLGVDGNTAGEGFPFARPT